LRRPAFGLELPWWPCGMARKNTRRPTPELPSGLGPGKGWEFLLSEEDPPPLTAWPPIDTPGDKPLALHPAAGEPARAGRAPGENWEGANPSAIARTESGSGPGWAQETRPGLGVSWILITFGPRGPVAGVGGRTKERGFDAQAPRTIDGPWGGPMGGRARHRVVSGRSRQGRWAPNLHVPAGGPFGPRGKGSSGGRWHRPEPSLIPACPADPTDPRRAFPGPPVFWACRLHQRRVRPARPSDRQARGRAMPRGSAGRGGWRAGFGPGGGRGRGMFLNLPR